MRRCEVSQHNPATMGFYDIKIRQGAPNAGQKGDEVSAERATRPDDVRASRSGCCCELRLRKIGRQSPPCCPGFPCAGAPFSSERRFDPCVLHSCLVRRATFSQLPVTSQQFDRFDGVETCVVHPVVSLAQEREIVGRVVAGILVKMGDSQTRRDFQAADDTAVKLAGALGRATSGPLFSLQHWRITGRSSIRHVRPLVTASPAARGPAACGRRGRCGC